MPSYSIRTAQGATSASGIRRLQGKTVVQQVFCAKRQSRFAHCKQKTELNSYYGVFYTACFMNYFSCLDDTVVEVEPGVKCYSK